MSKVRKIFSWAAMAAMVFGVVFTMRVPVSAATCSNGIKTCTITVKTKANYAIPGSESITLRQTKGVCEKESRGFMGRVKIKSSKQYGTWKVVAEPTDRRSVVKKTLSGGSVKLKLKPDKTYRVTVSWDSGAAGFVRLRKGNYTTYPAWEVGSTWKVSECY